MDFDTSELNPCELGTKDYWDKSYSTEIKNYLSHGDTGEVWFDESSQFRVIKWISSSPEIKKDDSIIDLGKIDNLCEAKCMSELCFRHR